MGRIDKYKTSVEPWLQQIVEWCDDCTEAQIAQKLGVSRTSFEKYKREHPELRQALDKGKRALVDELKGTLIKKAKGYYFTETKRIVKDVDGVQTVVEEEYKRFSPPDTAAIHLLLKNIDDDWRNDDKTTIDLKKEKLRIEREKSDNW